MPRRDPSESLRKYRELRSADRTPEPFGGAVSRQRSAFEGGTFVVQKHRARQLHYDFRLELDSVLRSWAVPKGPSPDPADKRLAMEVEDHPLEYADFEGIIPKGNYGAGAVVLWDRGRWVPLGDAVAGLEKGKLLFTLHGYKLRGLWTLVRTKRAAKEWLLIKESDGFAGPAAAARIGDESILSGLTVEELAAGHGRADEARAELVAAGLPSRPLQPRDVGLMLAETAKQPFSRQGWLFELKYDGWRVRGGRDPGPGGAGPRIDGRAVLRSRGGLDLAPSFPEIAKALAALPFAGVLDGEVVVEDREGVPRFELLQQRGLLTSAGDIQRAALALPATLHVFDLPAFAGLDLRGLTLRERKAVLARVLPASGPLRYVDHVDREGVALYERAVRAGFEGIVAKRADSSYRAGRSPAWLKVRAQQTGDFAVVGLNPSRAQRPGFGSLHVAVHDRDGFVYAGRVGSGLGDRTLDELEATLAADRIAKAPCRGTVPPGRGSLWVKPRLVCEVCFKEWTRDGVLRQPVFLRFRDDKRPEDCTRAGVRGAPSIPDAAAASTPSGVAASPKAERPRPPRANVKLGNLGKVFWPEDGYTKGDLVAYYREVAPWLLPYLHDRPLVLTRFPDGIHGKSFFQHDAPAFVPGWVRTERVWDAEGGKEIARFVCDDVESLLYLVNLGTIPLHVAASRVQSLPRPDWAVLDLDPKGAPFADVVRIALALREICDAIGLPAYAKTSGQAGLHVLLPLAGQLTFAEARSLAELLARIAVEELPEVATVVRPVAARGGRVYVDFGQNGQGRLIAAPLCVRPVAGAPVSMPLAWKDVGPRLDPRRFTIRTAVKRLEKQGDPLRPVLEVAPDLAAAIARLGERMASRPPSV